jgi:hypothetical protein
MLSLILNTPPQAQLEALRVFGLDPFCLRRCRSFLCFWLAVWVHSSASLHWTPAPVSDSTSAFGLLRSYGCRGFQTFSTRVEYPMSSNKSRSLDCSVFLHFSVETRNFVFSPPHGISYHTEFRIFGFLATFHDHTEFRVFGVSASFRRHTEFHSFRRFGVFPSTHGIPYLSELRRFPADIRNFVFSPFHGTPSACLMCGHSDDLVHAPPFALSITSTLLVGICPSQLP